MGIGRRGNEIKEEGNSRRKEKEEEKNVNKRGEEMIKK